LSIPSTRACSRRQRREPQFPGAQHGRRHAHREPDLADHHASASPHRTTLPTASGAVGYIQFNDHIATAEDDLEAAFKTLRDDNVTDLILDLRYNGGGYLDMASEVALHDRQHHLTSGRTFEKLVFNDKNPTRDPVTGEQLTPTPFHSTSQGFSGAAGRPLPTLNLDRVYIIAGPGTCSASESIIIRCAA
jgi:hypothetical protein